MNCITVVLMIEVGIVLPRGLRRVVKVSVSDIYCRSFFYMSMHCLEDKVRDGCLLSLFFIMSLDTSWYELVGRKMLK